MNIKSLLLGSAAALVAVSGARAADAVVVAEPEPAEYVRICDIYGAGYFYIPGTETCLRISGWVRQQTDTANRDARLTVGARIAGVDLGNGVGNPASITLRDRATYNQRSLARTADDNGFNQLTGAQINLDARSETEYGTLRGWIQLEGQTANTGHPADVGIAINRAMIQLGGLYMGYADSLFSSSSNIMGGSPLGNYGGFTYADTFNYHYEQRHQYGYQFSGSNGFWGAISLEHDGNEDYTPDVVGKIAYSQAWGGAWLSAAYDESAEGVGIRGGVQGQFGALTGRLDAYYQSNAAVTYGRDARWAVQGTALYQVNPNFGVAAGLEYRKDLAIAQTAYLPNSSAWAAQLGVNWQPVQNFLIGADVTYNTMKTSETFGLGGTDYVRFSAKQDWTAFRLRFQRNF